MFPIILSRENRAQSILFPLQERVVSSLLINASQESRVSSQQLCLFSSSCLKLFHNHLYALDVEVRSSDLLCQAHAETYSLLQGVVLEQRTVTEILISIIASECLTYDIHNSSCSGFCQEYMCGL